MVPSSSSGVGEGTGCLLASGEKFAFGFRGIVDTDSEFEESLRNIWQGLQREPFPVTNNELHPMK